MNNLSVDVIDNIKIIASTGTKATYGIGPNFIAPLILITTKQSAGTNVFNKSAPGTLTVEFNGYYKAREFYTPKYTPANQNITDNRTAIYWNPNVLTDANGNFKAEFFNSDVKGTYKIVVEGIDDNGNLGRAVYRYSVR
jgi:hypothetical protein